MGDRRVASQSRRRRFRPVLALLLLLAPLLGAEQAEQAGQKEAPRAQADKPALPPEFRVGPGDVLRIDVWKEPEVSGAVVVRPDGRISLPLLKDLEVNGLTPVEIEKLLTERLSKFLSSPDVTVIVQQINSKKVYLVGQVKKVGPLLLLSPMTVAQALSEAGGPTDFANTKRILVLRNNGGEQKRFTFNYKNFLKGEAQQDNIELKPGDTIVVP